MFSLKQAIAKMLREAGPQDLETLILECKIQSNEPADTGAAVATIEEMLRDGELYTDGLLFSHSATDFSSNETPHVNVFLARAFDEFANKT